MENTPNQQPAPTNQDVIPASLQPAVNPAPTEPVTPPASQAPSTASTDPVSPPPPATPKRSKAKWLIGLIILLLLAGGGTAAWYFTAGPGHKVASVTTTEDVPLLRLGSLNGPIGADTIFPNEEAFIASHTINLQIFEGLVGFRDQQIVPQLSTSWTNPNQTTWVFQIARNITFQNGDPMTTVDVVRSLQADLKNENWNQYLQTIKSVTQTGDHQVTIVTDEPDALLLNRLVYAFVFKTAGSTYYGTGPYSVDTTKPLTDAAVTLKAYDKYHGGAVHTKAVSFTIYDSNAALKKAFDAGQIDTFNTNRNDSTIQSLASSNSHFTVDQAGSYGLVLNMTRPRGVLADPKLREAVAYAIDRPSLVSQLGTAQDPAYGILPKSTIGYDSQATFPKLDVAKSKQLQAAAGFPNGAPLTFVYIKDVQSEPPILSKQLQAAGFNVTTVAASTPDEAVARIKTGTYDLFSVSYFSDYNDATDIFTAMLDSKRSDYGVYSNPAYDALVTAAEQTSDPAAHIQKVQAINRYIASNYLWIPVHTNNETSYTRPGYNVQANYMVTPSSVNYWQVTKTVTKAGS